jgi:A/G-specific adenine glycosylase
MPKNNLTPLTENNTYYLDASFSATVIQWQKQCGRHTLPWQNTKNAYQVWVSEIMLQQTQVASVIGYYTKFMVTFPNIFTLANADSETVMASWSGLGYYSRARNLHACAKLVVANYAGEMPRDPALLQQLPGIGRSTAAAISAFSYGTKAAIMDGNVKRVFARVFGIEGYPGAKPIESALWDRAEALLPDQSIEAYTQGLMDLGATLCKRGKPDCGVCPLSLRCVAHKEGRTEELPVRKPKMLKKEKTVTMMAILHNGHVLLEKRPEKGIWGGLLSLPEVSGHTIMKERQSSKAATSSETAVTEFSAQFGRMESVTELNTFSHIFTHYKLQITPYKIVMKSITELPSNSIYRWLDLREIKDTGLPAPIKNILLEI